MSAPTKKLPEQNEPSRSIAINPARLLTWNRVDLGVKLLYLRSRFQSMWARQAYEQHIKAFTLGSFTEPGSPEKNSIARYLRDFEQILSSIESRGFRSSQGLVPLARDGSILNGAHRTAACHHLGVSPHCQYLDEEPLLFDWRFFEARGMPAEMIEAAACELISATAVPTFVAICWPRSAEEHKKMADAVPNQVVLKRVELTERGLRNLVTCAYMGESWLGDPAREYPGAAGKAVEVGWHRNWVTIVAFQADGVDAALRLKEEIRNRLALGKHSIHITDDNEESALLAQLLLNPAALHFLNHARPFKYHDARRILNSLRGRLPNRLLVRDFAVDTGGALEVYGIRRASDIDIVGPAAEQVAQISGGTVNSHNDEIETHEATLNELMVNPSLSFMFEGIRFISLRQVYAFKNRRKTAKDLLDVESLRPYLGESRGSNLARALRYRFRFYREILRMRYRKWKLSRR